MCHPLFFSIMRERASPVRKEDFMEQQILQPYSEEGIKKTRSRKVKQFLIGGLAVLVMILLLMIDGESVLQDVMAAGGLLSQKEATELVTSFEEGYYGQYVFDYQDYKKLRSKYLTPKTMTYYDFYDYLNEVASMANDYASSFIFNTPEMAYYNHYIQKLKLSSVETAMRQVDGESLAYIAVKGLAPGFESQLTEFLESAAATETPALILDFTDNPLGTIDQTLSFINYFVSDAELLRYSGKNGYSHIIWGQLGSYSQEKIYILVDETVSGIGEIVALSLKHQLGDSVCILGRAPQTTPFLFDYTISEDHRYILKYAVGQWQVGDRSPGEISFPLDQELETTDLEAIFKWIAADLK